MAASSGLGVAGAKYRSNRAVFIIIHYLFVDDLGKVSA
jgi:hypothetical protein